MKFLIIGDPIEGLNPNSDTGLAILRACLLRGHQVFWTTPQNLILNGVTVSSFASCVKDCLPQSLPETDHTAHLQRVDVFDAVWIRKDPPMDWRYISLCWLLSAEEATTVMVNSPTQLIQYHEKMIPFRACREGFLQPNEVISTYLITGGTTRLPEAKSSSKWITKPWLGHGGREIKKWESLDEFQSVGLSDPSSHHGYLMLQRFFPEIHQTGDRRVFFIDGEYMGDFVRLPPKGRIEANLVQGGSAVKREMTSKEKDIVRRLGLYLKKQGIVVAGADMIAERISEVNITAPTGFETLYQLEGKRLADRLVQFVEGLVRQRA